MKRSPLPIIHLPNWKIITLLCALLWCSTAAHAEKIALLVAVGNYPSSSGWQHIHAVNDLGVIRPALMRQGFLAEHIDTLIDDKATREGILQALQQLLKRCKESDIVYFQFSGHGQQVADNGNDEPDGYDEAIVPYDSPMQFVPGVNEGQHLIRDDELGEYFQKIRKKIGLKGQLIVVLDACHSGTGTRGMAVARGTTTVMADSAWVRHHAAESPQETTQLEVVDSRNLSPMVAFFGAAQHQLNYETTDAAGREVGSLSLAFSTYFSAADTTTSYRGLFESIRKEMALRVSQQTPQSEGDLDRKVLGGQTIAQTDFFRIKSMRSLLQVQIDAGWLMGLEEDAIVGFFKPETHDFRHTTPVVSGTVIKSRPMESFIKLDTLCDPDFLRSAWVYVTDPSPGTLRVHVRLELQDSLLKQATVQKINDFKLILTEAPYDLIVIQEGQRLLLLDGNEQFVDTITLKGSTENQAKTIIQAAKHAGQAKMLRYLPGNSPDLQLKMEIIPVRVDDNGKVLERLDIAAYTDATGTIRLPEGLRFLLKVHNNGSIVAFYNLIDVQPNNEFNILFPLEKTSETAAFFTLQPGGAFEHPRVWKVNPPYGREIFKLVATPTEVDLRSIKNSGGQLTRGPAASSPLEKLISDSFFSDDVQSRGGELTRTGSETLNVQTLSFFITPKQ